MFQQVAEAIDDDLVADDQHPFAPVFAGDGVEHAAQAQDDVAPAFAARWAEIKFTDVLALFVQFRVLAGDAVHGQAVENAEFLFAQALVGHHGGEAVRIDARQHGLCRLLRPHVGRVQHDGRLLFRGEGGEPVAQGVRLARAKLGEGDIDIALGDGDQ